MQRVGDDRRTRRPIYAVNQQALRNHLDDINQTPQGQKLVDWYRDTGSLLKAYKQSYAGVDSSVLKEIDELIGIAESPGSSGLVRTAMITDAQQDLIMVVAGLRILGRYDVVSVGEEGVDLKDIDTGRTRRLILR